MKKKILLGVAVCMSLSTAAFAAPLENYHAGKAEVNVGTSVVPAMNISANGNVEKSDVKHRVEGGATVGIGHNFALQYRYMDSQMKPSGSEYNFRTQEYNIRYKLDKNVSVYAGQLHARAEDVGSGSATRNLIQAGVQYEAPVAKNMTGWASMGFGKDLQHYEAGVGYALMDNLDLDVFYQYTQVKNIQSVDFTAKGLYAGLSFHF
jgi:opacity protein-like surface antigen